MPLAPTQLGRTELICAATDGKAKRMRLLLDAGADKEAKDISVRAVDGLTSSLMPICLI
jgi:hypothetical protein